MTRAKKSVKRPVTADRPLFTLEASKVTDFVGFKPDVPEDLAPFVGIIAEGYIARLDIDRFVRGPGETAAPDHDAQPLGGPG